MTPLDVTIHCFSALTFGCALLGAIAHTEGQRRTSRRLFAGAAVAWGAVCLLVFVGSLS